MLTGTRWLICAVAAACGVLAVPAAAQGILPELPGVPAAGGEAPAPQTQGSRAEAEALLRVLRDDAARDRLLSELERIAQSPPDTEGEGEIASPQDAADAAQAATPPPEKPIGGRVVDGATGLLQSMVNGLREDVNDIRATWRRLSGLAKLDWAEAAAELPRSLLLLAATVGTALAGRYLAGPLFLKLGQAAARSNLIRRTLFVIAGVLIDILVVFAGLIVGLIVALLIHREDLPDLAAAYLTAFTVAGLLLAGLRAILSPATSRLRPVPLDDTAARYWTRRLGVVFVVVTIAEIFLLPAISSLATPITARAALVCIYAAVLLYVIWLVVVHREKPAAHFRRRAGEDEESAILAILAAIAPYWYIPVVAWLVVLLHQALTSGGAGLPVIAGSLELAAIAGFATVVLQGLSHLAERGVQLPAGLERAFPNLRDRIDMFAAIFFRIVGYLVVFFLAAFLLQDLGDVEIWDWLDARLGISVVDTAATIILVAFVGFAAWLVLSSWIDYRLASHHGHEPTAREKTLLVLLRNAGAIAILLVGAAYLLTALGVSVAPLLASAGVVGLAIGFGSQKLVQDIITGLFIQFENAINVGDVVEVGGKTGVVEKLTIRSVSLRDLGGVFHVVPFSSVDLVSNHMRGFSHHVADIGIAYREDIDAAKAEMLAAYDDLESDPNWNTKLVGGVEWFGVNELGDSAVVLRARLKTRPGEQWAVGRAYTELVKKRFDAAGIEIPFPHMTLWFGEQRDGRAPPAHLSIAREGRPNAGARREAPARSSAQSLDPAGPTDADGHDED